MFFLVSWMNATETVGLNGFWEENGFGSLGVKVEVAVINH